MSSKIFSLLACNPLAHIKLLFAFIFCLSTTNLIAQDVDLDQHTPFQAVTLVTGNQFEIIGLGYEREFAAKGTWRHLIGGHLAYAPIKSLLNPDETVKNDIAITAGYVTLRGKRKHFFEGTIGYTFFIQNRSTILRGIMGYRFEPTNKKKITCSISIDTVFAFASILNTSLSESNSFLSPIVIKLGKRL